MATAYLTSASCAVHIRSGCMGHSSTQLQNAPAGSVQAICLCSSIVLAGVTAGCTLFTGNSVLLHNLTSLHHLPKPSAFTAHKPEYSSPRGAMEKLGEASLAPCQQLHTPSCSVTIMSRGWEQCRV